MSAPIDELEFERRLRKEFLSEASDLLELASGVASKVSVDDLLKISSELESNLDSLRCLTEKMVSDRKKAA